jgi:hypothetical protein
MDTGSGADPTIVGEECHVVARELDGPRGTSNLSEDERDEYCNLVLLCSIHHKIIDSNPAQYTADRILAIKHDHESWIRGSLPSFSPSSQRQDETYAYIVDEWVRLADLENWNRWTSWLLSAGGTTTKERIDALDKLRLFLFSRVWPGKHPSLEAALGTFNRVLADLLNTYKMNSEPRLLFNTELQVTRYHKQVREWNPALYRAALKQYETALNMVALLTFELARAANLVCDHIRECLLPDYRIREGHLLITEESVWDDETMQVQSRIHQPRYATNCDPGTAYLGLDSLRGAQDK